LKKKKNSPRYVPSAQDRRRGGRRKSGEEWERLERQRRPTPETYGSRRRSRTSDDRLGKSQKIADGSTVEENKNQEKNTPQKGEQKRLQTAQSPKTTQGKMNSGSPNPTKKKPKGEEAISLRRKKKKKSDRLPRDDRGTAGKLRKTVAIRESQKKELNNNGGGESYKKTAIRRVMRKVKMRSQLKGGCLPTGVKKKKAGWAGADRGGLRTGEEELLSPRLKNGLLTKGTEGRRQSWRRGCGFGGEKGGGREDGLKGSKGRGNKKKKIR